MKPAKRFETELLSAQVKAYIVDELRSGQYRSLDRLPPEDAMAEELGVSRITLRHALALLEKGGFITRKRGVGTLINQKVLGLQARLDIERECSDLLRDIGYSVEVRVIGTVRQKAGDELGTKLEISPEEEVLAIEKLWLADGRPAILCTDYVPFRLISTEVPESLLGEPIFRLLSEMCDQDVQYDVTEIVPDAASGRVCDLLAVSPGTPIQMIEEVGFNKSDVPVLFSRERYRTDIVRFTLVRNKV